MSTFDCLYSFNLCLLRVSSDRRLRRCAATSTLKKKQARAATAIELDGKQNRKSWKTCFQTSFTALPGWAHICQKLRQKTNLRPKKTRQLSGSNLVIPAAIGSTGFSPRIDKRL